MPDAPSVGTQQRIDGHPWTVDWRGLTVVRPDYLSVGDRDAALSIAPPTDWNPYVGQTVSDQVIFGYGDPGQVQALTIGNRLEAGSYQAWPTNGQMGLNSQVPLLDLAEEAGVDIGLQAWTGPGPRMVFLPPPSYSEQTTPIPAVGV